MKNKIISFLVPLIFILSGLFVGFVPVVIPMIHQAETNGQIAEYSEKISQLTDDERNEVVEEMKDYNSGRARQRKRHQLHRHSENQRLFADFQGNRRRDARQGNRYHGKHISANRRYGLALRSFGTQRYDAADDVQ